MPARKEPQTRVRTAVAARRVAAGLTQRELALRTGISFAQIRRLERGEVGAPNLAHLVNVAIVLGCSVTEVFEPEWLTWHDLGAPQPEVTSPEGGSAEPS